MNNNNNNININSELYNLVYNSVRDVLKNIDINKLIIDIKNNLDKELKNE